MILKKSVKIGIGALILAIIIYLVNKSKASGITDTTANKNTGETPSATPSKTNVPSPAGTPIPIDVIISPSGEPEKVSLFLRSMNVRGTAVNMSIWTNPYDALEYFVRLDDVEYFKWRIDNAPIGIISLAILPYQMTLTNLNTSVAYKIYDEPYVTKTGVVEGFVSVGHKMAEDFKTLANQPTAIKIYT